MHAAATKSGGSSPHTRGARGTPWNPARYGGDHPRIRGEHNRRGHPAGCAGGIIPAYAGSTAPGMASANWFQGSSPHTRGARTRRSWWSCRIWDHPRIRGEHYHFPSDDSTVTGIIPAYAGSTDGSEAGLCHLAGSSPHTRGAQGVQVAHVLARGIIPAYAGSTYGLQRFFLNFRDHPRIRGEHVGGDFRFSSYPGSSPHTRGAHSRMITGLR